MDLNAGWHGCRNSGDDNAYYSYYRVYYIVVDDVVRAEIVVTIEPCTPYAVLAIKLAAAPRARIAGGSLHAPGPVAVGGGVLCRVLVGSAPGAYEVHYNCP